MQSAERAQKEWIRCVRPISVGVLEREEWWKKKELLQQQRGVGNLEAEVDRGRKPNFTPLSLDLNPRAKKDGNWDWEGWKWVESAG